MRRIATPLAALVLAGCLGDLAPVSFVDRTRIVAARVSPDRDPEIAEPSPGDAVTVEWLTITPAEPRPIAASWIACRPLAGTGTPVCGGAIAPLPPRTPSTDPLITALTLPSEAELAGATSWMIFGAVCAGGGTPVVDVNATSPTARCEGGDRERADLVALEIPIAADPALANRHPSVRDEPWTIDGAAWDAPPADLALEGCAAIAGDASLPAIPITLGRAVVITIGWSEDDRETHADGREALQYSHFVTEGELQRSNSAADDLLAPGTPVTIEWTLPGADRVPAEGLVVRFPLVVRDGRGGVDRADRALCVTP